MNSDEWIRPSEAVEMLQPILNSHSARMRICKRAHEGMIKARAEQYRHGDHSYSAVDIPKEFWWAEGQDALEQDWAAGDFSTWIEGGSIQLKAFGVLFARADVAKMLPTRMGAPMTAERRRLVLASTSVLKSLGHAGFERVLLEFGVPEDVGHGGSLQQRANSLARFALGNPDAKVLGGGRVSDVLVQRAMEAFDRGLNANVTEQEKFEFQEALARDGGVELSQTIARNATEQSAELTSNYAVVEPPGAPRKPRRKVFVVHGHDEGPREAVARFLVQLDFEPVILHERPNRGRTVITKFQEEAADVGFAVVVMTPDDSGGKAGESSQPRARQNVVFELGYFIGVLGPERVVALVKGAIERPSDFEGVVYVSYDTSGGWKMQLGKELATAGFVVDLNAAL